MKRIIHKLFSYKLIRYSIGGGLAAVLDLLMLYVFTDFFHVYYLYSAILAFIISLSFGYFFQKYITFRDYSNKHLLQGGLFLLFQLMGQGVYMLLLWLLVDKLLMYYLLAAIVAKAVAFIRNYISNYFFNFKK